MKLETINNSRCTPWNSKLQISIIQATAGSWGKSRLWGLRKKKKKNCSQPTQPTHHPTHGCYGSRNIMNIRRYTHEWLIFILNVYIYILYAIHQPFCSGKAIIFVRASWRWPKYFWRFGTLAVWVGWPGMKLISNLEKVKPPNLGEINWNIFFKITYPYCWWKTSCTSWYGKYPIVYRVSYMLGGAGFLSSTLGSMYGNMYVLTVAIKINEMHHTYRSYGIIIPFHRRRKINCPSDHPGWWWKSLLEPQCCVPEPCVGYVGREETTTEAGCLSYTSIQRLLA